ncbi:MAG: substrate-binding domain-containing protein [Rhodospirillales bacterium]|nr:substrate-binding domain-containing protein [Rhodospirillales bacterium]
MAKNLTFSLISKDIEDINFINAWRGCSDAAQRNGDKCRHMGDTRVGYFRGQLAAIQEAISLDVDGIAISVTNSSFIAQPGLAVAQKHQIPVITFDSDLEEPERHLRMAYIGPDNFEIGIQLGELLKAEFPNGANICVMSGGRFDPNLNHRIAGLRHSLRRHSSDQKHATPENTTLIPMQGETGWREHPRCPLFNRGDDGVALSQFAQAIQNPAIDAIVPVGAWLLGNPDRLEKIIKDCCPIAPKLIMATGTPSEQQLRLTEKAMMNGYVAIDFYRMGELIYQQLLNFATGQNVVIAPEPLLRIQSSTQLKTDDAPM